MNGNYKFVVFILILFLFNVKPLDSKNLFILSGQSNMVRLDPYKTFVPELLKTFNQSGIYDIDELIIIKSAKGGESIRKWYYKRPKTLYFEIYDLIKTLDLTNIDSVNFIWMQGESDTFKKRFKTYKNSLLSLFKRFQKDIRKLSKDKNIKVNYVIGRINNSKTRKKGWRIIRQIQKTSKFNKKRIPWINTDDLWTKETGEHMTEEGYDILGIRFAKKIIEIILN